MTTGVYEYSKNEYLGRILKFKRLHRGNIDNSQRITLAKLNQRRIIERYVEENYKAYKEEIEKLPTV